MLAPPPSAGEALGTRHLGEYWGEPKHSLPASHTCAHLTQTETGPFLHCDGNMFIETLTPQACLLTNVCVHKGICKKKEVAGLWLIKSLPLEKLPLGQPSLVPLVLPTLPAIQDSAPYVTLTEWGSGTF